VPFGESYPMVSSALIHSAQEEADGRILVQDGVFYKQIASGLLHYGSRRT
jgi:hypothetical protein